MKREDTKIIAVKSEGDPVWCCYMKALPGIPVQVENIEDAPKELANMFRVLAELSVKSGHIHKEILPK